MSKFIPVKNTPCSAQEALGDLTGKSFSAGSGESGFQAFLPTTPPQESKIAEIPIKISRKQPKRWVLKATKHRKDYTEKFSQRYASREWALQQAEHLIRDYKAKDARLFDLKEKTWSKLTLGIIATPI